jgi:hypothetical protein
MKMLWGKTLLLADPDWRWVWSKGEHMIEATLGPIGLRWQVSLYADRVSPSPVAFGDGETLEDAAKAADLACPDEHRAAFGLECKLPGRLTVWGRTLEQSSAGFWHGHRDGTTIEVSHRRLADSWKWRVSLLVLCGCGDREARVALGEGPDMVSAVADAESRCPREHREAFGLEQAGAPSTDAGSEVLAEILDAPDPCPTTLAFAAREMRRERDRWHARVKVLEERLARVREAAR